MNWNRLLVLLAVLFSLSAVGLNVSAGSGSIWVNCRSIDGKGMCLISQADLDGLLDEYRESARALLKTQKDCKRLNES